MVDMDYGKLLNRSFSISWEFKVLWVLGFFASFFGGSSMFINQEHQAKVAGVVSDHPYLIMIILIYALLLVFFFLIMHLICAAGLTDAVVKVEREARCSLKESFKVGAHYFWSFGGLWLIALFTMIAIIALLAIPVAVIFSASVVVGFLILVLVIPIFMAALYAFTSVYGLAQRELIIGGRDIADAIMEGFHLFKAHPGKNLVVFLISLAIGLILFTLNAMLVLVFALPLIFGSFGSATTAVILLIVEVPVFITVAIVVTGYFGAMLSSFFTLFYLELRKLTPYQAIAAAPAPSGPIS
jgi:hypothetical protein